MAVLSDVCPFVLIGKISAGFFDEDLESWRNRDSEFRPEFGGPGYDFSVLMEERGGLLPDHFFGRIPEQPFGRGIEQRDEPGLVRCDNRIAGMADQRLLNGQCPVQTILSPLAIGDIGMGADDTERGTVRRSGDDFAPVEDPLVRTVFAPHPVLVHVDRSLAAEMPLDIGHSAGEIVGMDARGPFLQRGADLILGVSQHLLPAIREEDVIGVSVPIPDAVPVAGKRIGPPLFRLAQPGLMPMLFRHILDHGEGPDDLTLGVSQRRVGPLARDTAAILSKVVVGAMGGLVSIDQSLPDVFDMGTEFLRDEKRRVASDGVARGVSKDPFGSGIPRCDPEVAIPHDMADRHLVDLLLELPLALFQALLSLMPCSDVLNEGHEVIDGCVIPADGAGRDGGIDDPAIPMDKALVQGVAVDVPGEHSIELRKIRSDVIGMGQLGPGLGNEFVRRIPEDLTQAVVDLDPAFLRRGDGHADQAQFEIAAIAFLALPEGFLKSLLLGDVAGDTEDA